MCQTVDSDIYPGDLGSTPSLSEHIKILIYFFGFGFLRSMSLSR